MIAVMLLESFNQQSLVFKTVSVYLIKENS